MTDKKQNATKEVPEEGASIYDLFETDKNYEREGIWLNYGKFGRIKVARAGGSNARFTKVVETKFRPYRRQVESGTFDESAANDLLVEAFAETVILGWENVEGRNGKALPFSRENVIQLLKDLPDLFADIREQATKLANFRLEEVETDSGN